MRKDKSKEKNEEKIVAALDALSKSVRIMKNYGAKFDSYIDEAAMRGDDSRAKQLIKQKIRAYALAEQLTTLEGNIKLGIFTSQAYAELGKLPAAIEGCKGNLSSAPDFSKLGKSIGAIFDEMNKSEAELSKLNDILSPKTVSSTASTLDAVLDNEEETDQFKAEYASMIQRLKSKVSTDKVVKPETEKAGITGDIDYAGIIDEENKKK